MSVNQVIIVGHLGRDPEVRSFANGGRVANMSVGTSRAWKDRTTGERVEKTEWHRISVTNEFLVGICEERLRKGDKVFVSGRLETRKWQDQNGQDRYSTDIVVAGYEGTIEVYTPSNGGGAGQVPRGADENGAGMPPSRDLDDEIPF